MTVAGADTDTLRAALERNVAGVHGPLGARDAVATLVERCVELASGAPVAVPGVDAVLDEHGVAAALEAAGLELVRPDDDGWREAVAGAAVGVTGAPAAAAEVGTVGVACGPGAPRAVSLLPDAHVCLLPVSRVHARFEDALAAVTAAGLPRHLVWVSGPSRSADIEKRITLGVHGPRTFEVVLVDDRPS